MGPEWDFSPLGEGEGMKKKKRLGQVREFYFILFLFFRAIPIAYGSFPGLGSNQSYSRQPTPQLTSMPDP